MLSSKTIIVLIPFFYLAPQLLAAPVPQDVDLSPARAPNHYTIERNPQNKKLTVDPGTNSDESDHQNNRLYGRDPESEPPLPETVDVQGGVKLEFPEDKVEEYPGSVGDPRGVVLEFPEDKVEGDPAATKTT